MEWSKFTFDLMGTVGKGNMEDKCRKASVDDLCIALGQLHTWASEYGILLDAHDITMLAVINTEMERRNLGGR